MARETLSSPNQSEQTPRAFQSCPPRWYLWGERYRYGPALSLLTTDGHELEPPNNGNVGWSANEPYTTAFVVKSRSAGAATRHIFRSGSSSTDNHILFTTTGGVPNARHEGARGSVTINGGSMVNDTT